MKINFKKYLIEIIRLTFAFLFIISALEKFKSIENFALNVDAYQIFPSLLVNFIAVIIPSLELFIGFGILFKFKLKANLFLYLILMISFTILIIIAMFKGLDIDCGCFGESSVKVGFEKLAENILIIIGNLYLIKFSELFE
ncbi:MAG: MauE/DoxX family redox-associated membrane protein [Ignavibacteria bacterium]